MNYLTLPFGKLLDVITRMKVHAKKELECDPTKRANESQDDGDSKMASAQETQRKYQAQTAAGQKGLGNRTLREGNG